MAPRDTAHDDPPRHFLYFISISCIDFQLHDDFHRAGYFQSPLVGRAHRRGHPELMDSRAELRQGEGSVRNRRRRPMGAAPEAGLLLTPVEIDSGDGHGMPRDIEDEAAHLVRP